MEVFSQNGSGLLRMTVHLLVSPTRRTAAAAAAPAEHDELGFKLCSLLGLASSGIIAVLIKHVLNAAFSSQVQAPFTELPANMVGCFFMGFLVRSSSIHGAGTSIAGCITSYASWNHAIVAAAYGRQWSLALCSLFVGLQLGYMSYRVGLDAAEMLFELYPRLRPDATKHRDTTTTTTTGLLWSCVLWISVTLLALFDAERKQLWLSCALAPQGVWIRQLLSRLNPKFPVQKFGVGTWAANFISSGLQTALELVKGADPTTGCLVDAFQQGCLGSMSSLSAIVAETHSLYADGQRVAQAYSHVVSSMVSSLLLGGVVIYMSPLAFLEMGESPATLVSK